MTGALFTDNKLDALFRRLLVLSPVLWGIVFFLLVYSQIPPAPRHGDWDHFTLLNAISNGDAYLATGWGSVAFLSICRGMVALLPAPESWNIFHPWRELITAQAIFLALSIATFSSAIRVVFGGLSAHLVGALLVGNGILRTVALAPSQNCWGVGLLLVTISILILPQLATWVKAALLILPTAAAILIMESWLPVLVVLVPMLAGSIPREPRQIFSLLGATLSAALLVLIAQYLTIKFLPGFKDSLTGRGVEGIGWWFGGGEYSLAALAEHRSYLKPGLLLLILAILGIARGCLSPLRSFWPLLLFPILLVLTLPLFAAQNPNAFRQSYLLLVPFAVLGAAFLLQPPFPTKLYGITATSFLLIFFGIEFFGQRTARRYAEECREDHFRYHDMLTLRWEYLAIAGANEAAAIEFIHRRTGNRPEDYRWEIMWPDFSTGKVMPDRDWVLHKLRSEKRVAISPRIAGNILELLPRYGDIPFYEHPSGWWITLHPSDFPVPTE